MAADRYGAGRGPQAAHGLARGCRTVRALPEVALSGFAMADL